jgi:transcriptional regulator with XRE-family HTH domain
MPLDPNKLRALMEARSLDQSQLALLARLPQPYISQWLRGIKTDCKVSKLQALTRALGCKPEDLLTR